MDKLRDFQTFTSYMKEEDVARSIQEKTALQDKYASFFKGLLKKYDVGSPAELSDEDKVKFFDEVNAGWKEGEGETGKVDEALLAEALTVINEQSDLQAEYATYFKELLDEFNTTSPGKLSADQKKEFFNKVKAGWVKGKGRK